MLSPLQIKVQSYLKISQSLNISSNVTKVNLSAETKSSDFLECILQLYTYFIFGLFQVHQATQLVPFLVPLSRNSSPFPVCVFRIPLVPFSSFFSDSGLSIAPQNSQCVLPPGTIGCPDVWDALPRGVKFAGHPLLSRVPFATGQKCH